MATEANALIRKRWSLHRMKDGAPVAADVPGPGVPSAAYVLDTTSFDTILIAPVLTGGADPTVVLTPYLYDPDKNAFYNHVASGAAPSGQVIEVACYGHRMAILATTVAGNPTKLEILVAPGQRSTRTED